jgi:hypothetical protein
MILYQLSVLAGPTCLNLSVRTIMSARYWIVQQLGMVIYSRVAETGPEGYYQAIKKLWGFCSANYIKQSIKRDYVYAITASHVAETDLRRTQSQFHRQVLPAVCPILLKDIFFLGGGGGG